MKSLTIIWQSLNKVVVISPVFPSNKGGIESHLKLLSEYQIVDHIIVAKNFKFFDGITREIKPFFDVLRLINTCNIVWAHNPRISWWLRLIRPRGSILNSSHGFIFHNSSTVIKRIYFFTVQILCKYMKIRVICVSKSDYEKCWLETKLYLPNPCKFDHRLIKNNEKIRQCIYIGRASTNKRIDRLLKFHNDNPDMKLIIVANKQEKNNFPKKLQPFVITDISDCELSSLLAKTKYYISVSDYEGFGLALIEAIAHSCVPILFLNEAYKRFAEDGLKYITYDNREELDYIDSSDEIWLNWVKLNKVFSDQFSVKKFKEKFDEFVDN